MVAVWALVVLACIWTVVGLAVLVGMAVYLVRSRGEESCCEDCDDWMDIADVVSDDPVDRQQPRRSLTNGSRHHRL